MKGDVVAPLGLFAILLLCLAAAVLVAGCSSQPAKTLPPLITTGIPATTTPAAATLPVTTAGACREGLTWCNGHCSDLAVAIGDCGSCGNVCPDGQTCLGGQCCDRGLALCNGSCTRLDSDAGNCGSCGNACPSGEICHEGNCLNMNIVCPAGQTECFDERCHDLKSDNMNCGMCGRVCPAFSGCTNSVCVAMESEGISDIVINMPV